MSSTSLAPAFRPASPALRLTRRGRLVVFVGSLLLALAAALVFAQVSAAISDPSESTDVVVVRSDDTLWSIASAHADGDDVRDAVAQIQQLNDLDGGLVRAGQHLLVPAHG
ncbi:LysM peptidoglycan-binding domain-containing protein [Nocardioides acrostichi]|uniref:LysM peptidoglycan-binding domain-containing protein n=1 Tax=Nocardioides acrostichi TaxID=2784339 RepID=A0A930V0X3_9ACTN|nr:LysM peptidoglycan-binding domain-containing protein [Nocardioides acrostichi]MBF4161687.1 LysM peptidoglycan-binding domain-containing protein [Nocardioides acrostichi]